MITSEDTELVELWRQELQLLPWEEMRKKGPIYRDYMNVPYGRPANLFRRMGRTTRGILYAMARSVLWKHRLVHDVSQSSQVQDLRYDLKLDIEIHSYSVFQHTWDKPTVQYIDHFESREVCVVVHQFTAQPKDRTITLINSDF